MKTIDLSMDVDTGCEAESLQCLAEHAMNGITGFFDATSRPVSKPAIAMLNMLESLRDQAEDIQFELEEM